jgi:hypothetical protein
LTVSCISGLLEVGERPLDELGQELLAVPGRGERVVAQLEPASGIVGSSSTARWPAPVAATRSSPSRFAAETARIV